MDRIDVPDQPKRRIGRVGAERSVAIRQGPDGHFVVGIERHLDLEPVAEDGPRIPNLRFGKEGQVETRKWDILFVLGHTIEVTASGQEGYQPP